LNDSEDFIDRFNAETKPREKERQRLRQNVSFSHQKRKIIFQAEGRRLKLIMCRFSPLPHIRPFILASFEANTMEDSLSEEERNERGDG
jgi:hypothetical protein